MLSIVALALTGYSFCVALKHIPSLVYHVLHRLTSLTQTLLFLAAVHTLFLDGVWWFILRARTNEKVDFGNINQHGPVNLVVILTLLYLGNFYPPPYLLVLGMLYLVCYGSILYISGASSGEFVYYFIDIRKPKNLICLLFMLLWYFVCYVMITNFVWMTSSITLSGPLAQQDSDWHSHPNSQVFKNRMDYSTFS